MTIKNDQNDPLLMNVPDNVSGFTPEMIFDALRPFDTGINTFGNRLKNQSLLNTPTTEVDYDNLLNVYDVFNN